MVLTHSMASTNNQGDEPRTIALERQVQTLATTVERLTKQNHDLEEQLRQRNARPNNHKDEQEGTKKDPKEAMPQANKSDKTPAVHPSQKRHHRTWL